MYGLEKEPKKKKFHFDLEKEVATKPKRKKEILDDVEEKIHDIKKLLREGASEKEFDKLGVLLHGYTSLQKVLKKVTK
jgi:hypothetical protein